MKKSLSVVALGILLSFFSNQTKPIDSSINQRFLANRISEETCLKEDNYNYPFDDGNHFKGENDRYETRSPLEDSEAEIYDIYKDGRRDKVNFGLNSSTSSDIATYASTDDKNENNDTFKDATIVYKVNNSIGMIKSTSSIPATISQKTSGWGPWKKTYIDKDFYCYDVVVTGTLELTLTNIPSGCDYDLRLYRLSNSLTTSYEDLVFGSYLFISKNGGNADEHIKIDVTPGTFYACVYAYNDATFDNDHPYTLTFEQVEDDSSPNRFYNITEGRKNGDLCAIWTSGYKPLGITPMTISDSDAQVEFNNYNKYPFIHNLYDVYHDQDITYSKIYVWDLGLRAAIYTVLNEILNAIVNYDAWKDNAQSTFNILINKAGLRLSIDGLMISILEEVLEASVASVLGPLGIAVGIISVLVSLASYIACFTLTSPFNIKKCQLREYLINAKAALEVGRGTSDQEVVVLTYRYHLGKYFIDYSPVYKANESNLYNSTLIYETDDGSRFTGTIESFNDYEEIMEDIK